MELELESYMFLGVTVALSVLGFFLKREAKKAADSDMRISTLEKLMGTNDVTDNLRWKIADKLMEDRRSDVQNIYNKIDEMRRGK